MTLLLRGQKTFVFHEKNQSGKESRVQEMQSRKNGETSLPDSGLGRSKRHSRVLQKSFCNSVPRLVFLSYSLFKYFETQTQLILTLTIIHDTFLILPNLPIFVRHFKMFSNTVFVKSRYCYMCTLCSKSKVTLLKLL